MNTITWRNADTSGRRYLFEVGEQRIGTLILSTGLSSNADYATPHGNLLFKRAGFFDNRILLFKKGEVIGEIHNSIIGKRYLQFTSGTSYTLLSNLFGRNIKWIDSNNNAVVEYEFATLKSMGKGSIQTTESISVNDKEVLASSGLVVGKVNTYRLPFLFMILCAAIALLAKFI
jgi:hypothetical protein